MLHCPCPCRASSAEAQGTLVLVRRGRGELWRSPRVPALNQPWWSPVLGLSSRSSSSGSVRRTEKRHRRSVPDWRRSRLLLSWSESPYLHKVSQGFFAGRPKTDITWDF